MLLTRTLKHPITVDGQEITEISLRRPKVRDTKLANRKKDEIEQSVEMIAMLAELKPSTIEELDVEDFTAVATEMGKLLAPKEEAS